LVQDERAVTVVTLPAGLPVEAADADALLARVTGQLDDGADFVKLYLDGPDPETAPWTAAEVGRVAEAAHRRGHHGAQQRRHRLQAGDHGESGQQAEHDSALGSVRSRGRAVAGAEVASRRKAHHGSGRTVFHEGSD
jgi:hypothetical protein